MQPDKELVVETTGGDREQPGTVARVADLELCHPAHVGSKVGIDDDSDYGDVDDDYGDVDDDYGDVNGEGGDEDDSHLELCHPAHVGFKVGIDDDSDYGDVDAVNLMVIMRMRMIIIRN